MHFPRRAGILLHPTSLSGPYGIGEIGPQARTWIDFLLQAGQTYWQMLPLNPTGYGDSPYQALSTFAGNSMLISFEDLVEDGLLSERSLKNFPGFPRDFVDYGPVLKARGEVMDRVCKTFQRRASKEIKEEFKQFCKDQGGWLEDYALFMSLKREYGLRPWVEWDEDLIHRGPEALKNARMRLKEPMRHVRIRQYLFDRQWRRLREYAMARGVTLVGDLPIFVSHDSADVWANQELFSLDDQGQPTVVAGVPPDYFSATGQLWGNPLYKWDLHKQTGYAWWMHRMRRVLSQVDIVRIDHFRGFESYWEVPGGDDTAMNGRWVKGPGDDFFKTLGRELGEIPVIAEDLGVITEEVDQLRDEFNLPGMRILHFSFIPDVEPHLKPEGFPENCIVYTGTHDNDTTVGWFWREPGGATTESAEEIQRERKIVLSHVHTDGSHIHWDLIAFAHKLRPHTVIVPLQDVLGLGQEARMNVPGRPQGNWGWRFTLEQIRREDLRRLHDITEWADRLNV